MLIKCNILNRELNAEKINSYWGYITYGIYQAEITHKKQEEEQKVN